MTKLKAVFNGIPKEAAETYDGDTSFIWRSEVTDIIYLRTKVKCNDWVDVILHHTSRSEIGYVSDMVFPGYDAWRQRLRKGETVTLSQD